MGYIIQISLCTTDPPASLMVTTRTEITIFSMAAMMQSTTRMATTVMRSIIGDKQQNGGAGAMTSYLTFVSRFEKRGNFAHFSEN